MLDSLELNLKLVLQLQGLSLQLRLHLHLLLLGLRSHHSGLLSLLGLNLSVLCSHLLHPLNPFLAPHHQQPLGLVDVLHVADGDGVLDVEFLLSKRGLDVLFQVRLLNVLHLLLHRNPEVVHREVTEAVQDGHVLLPDSVLVHPVHDALRRHYLQTLYDILADLLEQNHGGVGDVVDGVVARSDSLLLNPNQGVTLRGGGVHDLVNTRGVTDHTQVVVVQPDEFVDVANGVPNLTDRGVLEPTLRILTAVVEDARLLVDVVQLKRLQLPTLSELYVLQALDVNHQPVRLSLGNGLLELEVRKLKHVGEPDAAVNQRLRDHIPHVRSHGRVRHPCAGEVVHVPGHVVHQPVVEDELRPHDVHPVVHVLHLHLMWGASKHTVWLLLVVVPLIEEPCVPEAILFLFEVHRVHGYELEAQDLHHVLVIP